MKKKVLIVGISGNCGGIETLFHQLFATNNILIDIDFITFDTKCAFEEEYIKLGYNIFHLPSRISTLFRFNGIVKDFYKQHNYYDFIWVNTASTSMYQFQYYGKKMTKAKIITHSHGIKSEESSFIRGLINKFLACINRGKVMRSTDYYFACSKKAGEKLFGENKKDSIKIVHNGVVIDNFLYNESYRKDVRKEYGIADDDFVIGMVGRLATVKNPYKAISVLKSLIKRHSNVKLMFVGTGELLEEINGLIKKECLDKYVVITGFCKQVYKMYSAFDMLIMPSFFEGLPLSAVEAQVSGLPCILSNMITEEVKLTDNVVFLPIADSDDKWTECVEKFMNSEIIRTDSSELENSCYNIKNSRKEVYDYLGVVCENES